MPLFFVREAVELCFSGIKNSYLWQVFFCFLSKGFALLRFLPSPIVTSYRISLFLEKGDMLQLGRWSFALGLIIIHQSLCAQVPGPVDPGKLPAHQEVVLVTGTFVPVPASDVDRPVTFIELDSRDHLYK